MAVCGGKRVCDGSCGPHGVGLRKGVRIEPLISGSDSRLMSSQLLGCCTVGVF